MSHDPKSIRGEERLVFLRGQTGVVEGFSSI
jgi:hypothetical protein